MHPSKFLILLVATAGPLSSASADSLCGAFLKNFNPGSVCSIPSIHPDSCIDARNLRALPIEIDPNGKIDWRGLNPGTAEVLQAQPMVYQAKRGFQTLKHYQFRLVGPVEKTTKDGDALVTYESKFDVYTEVLEGGGERVVSAEYTAAPGPLSSGFVAQHRAKIFFGYMASSAGNGKGACYPQHAAIESRDSQVASFRGYPAFDLHACQEWVAAGSPPKSRLESFACNDETRGRAVAVTLEWLRDRAAAIKSPKARDEQTTTFYDIDSNLAKLGSSPE